MDNSGGYDGVTIEGGKIQEFRAGIQLDGANHNQIRKLSLADNGTVQIQLVSADNSVIAKNAVYVTSPCSGPSCPAGIFLGGSNNVLVEGNDVLDATFGIEVSRSFFNRVTRNSVGGRSGLGVFVLESAVNVIDRNSVFGVDGPGMVLNGAFENLIENNALSEGASHGISFTQNHSDRNLVSKNTTIGNSGDGISITAFGSSGNTVERNVASANALDGIEVRIPETTLTANRANDNGNLGIEAVPGVIDGGGNKASGNGNPLQCLNVVCR